ncbi:hypothetical protein LARI1_G000807 [Lachnellula arida]|uniref:Calcofluor white hypersensitive protein n=2 Tax=Lachnellula TaxID=47830 RepID=A0A8T9BQG9_9HELO|nr:hypothetical protein LARI1_G000807 [Lachnellula arida]TVY90165.1 hypothetical protein LAWI1_G003084 [Lachnellula willkommii]
MAQPKSRIPLILGLTAAGGVGYYLYAAGGNPKVAEKQFESMLLFLSLPDNGRVLLVHTFILTQPPADLSKASAKVKSEVPGQGQRAQKEGEKWASEAGAKVDSAADKARAEFAKAEGKFEELRKDTGKKIDQADRKVEAEASKAKSGISSWFGGK